jgi:hypothetical protein
MVSKKTSQLVKKIEQDLLTLYGSPLLSGESLQKAMGYKTIYALRQAIARKTIPVHVFKIENRRGNYALTNDVAVWLVNKAFHQPKKIHKEENNIEE